MTGRNPSIRYQATPSSGLGSLIGMCIAGLAALAIILSAVFHEPDRDRHLAWLQFMTNGGISNFRLVGVPLGAEQNWWRHKFPNADFVQKQGDAGIGRLATEGGFLTTWFADTKNGTAAYRIRFERSFRGYDESDLVDDIATELGRTIDSHCQNSKTMGSKNCRYVWKPGHGIRVDLFTRTRGDRVMVQVVGTDTYLVGKSRGHDLKNPDNADSAYQIIEGAPRDRGKPRFSQDTKDRIFMPYGIRRD